MAAATKAHRHSNLHSRDRLDRPDKRATPARKGRPDKRVTKGRPDRRGIKGRLVNRAIRDVGEIGAIPAIGASLHHVPKDSIAIPTPIQEERNAFMTKQH